MAALAPGDPKLVAMIVNHLKNQGLFDQFRRDCLADVDTKPAYQNLRQRVDNFVSNHLASHTWSPHLNKNQLRNSLRQMVLQSGMLEVGVDRIISQVVDPKINHIFRPQVEKAVHEFLATLDRKEEPAAVSCVQNSEKQEPTTTGVSSSGPSTSKANDALSILDTITSLNQEASAARSTVENLSSKNGEKSSKKNLISEISKSQQSFDLGMEKDHTIEETEKLVLETKMDDGKFYSKLEGSINALIPVKDFEEKDEKTENLEESVEDMNGKKDKIDEKKMDKKDVVLLRRDEHVGLSKEERRGKRKEYDSVKYITAALAIKQTAKENLKKEYSLEDSDFEGLSDITVSSVHTSDLSSFDEDDDDEEEEGEVPASDSTEEDQEQSSEEKDTKLETNEEEQKEGKAKPGRHPYVHKPFLYSKYYSDSDDEETVVQRRQSIAKEKAERLLRRQWNRERVEDEHKHVETENGRPPEETQRDEKYLQTLEKGVNSNSDVEINSRKMQQPTALISKVNKATLKEQKVLEKKVALRRKRKGDSRTVSEELALHHEARKRKREQPEEFQETQIKTENKEKAVASSTKDSKSTQSNDVPPKPVRRLSESIQSNDECGTELKMDHEPCRKQLRSNSSSQASVMEALEVNAVNKLNDFRVDESMCNKESPKQKDEIKNVKESDGKVVVTESGSRTEDIHIDAAQKLGNPSAEEAMTNCHHVILSKSDSKALVSTTSSADSSAIEFSQDAKSREHSKVKEEKGTEKGKEKRHDAESSWSKSRENIQEDAKGHEKNKEKRNEFESTRPKFKENTHDAKASEKGKEKRNDSQNSRSKFRESSHEDAKSHEKSKERRNESEHSRTKSKENAQDDKGHERGKEKRNEFEHSRSKSKEHVRDDKGHERGKEKRNESERSRSRSKESLQEDVKGHEKGKERRGDSGSSRSKSREKIQEDTRSHERVKEIRNESESSRSKSRENLQEDVRSKEKRKNFENSQSRSKEDLQEDKGNEKRVEKRQDSETSRSKSKENIESSRSKSKQDIEYNQKGIEKRHDSETTRSKSKEHSETSRSKSRDKLQRDVQYNERVEKRHDSENTHSKSKETFESSRSKSREKVQEVVQDNEKGQEKKRISENNGSKPKEQSESFQSRFKEKVQDDVQSKEKGIEKRHDSRNMHFENSRLRSKEDLQEDKVHEKKMEKRHNFENTRSKSREHSEHSRSKSKEHSESSRSKYKEKVQEDIQNSGKGIDRKHNSENTHSKSRDHSERSRSKSKEKGQENVQDTEKGKEKKNDLQSIRSKSKEYSENVQAKSKEKPQGSEKGIEKKGYFENIRSRSKEKVLDIQSNEKLKEKESKSHNSLSKSIATDHEDVQSSEKRSKLENCVSKSEENVETAKGNGSEEGNEPENGQSESKAHLQEDTKKNETEKEKKNGSENSESKLKEQHMKDIDETNDTGKKPENSSKTREKVQDDAKKGTDMENSQLKSKENTPDTKEIAHNSTGDLKMETEKSIKTEDKLEEKKETVESEGSEVRHMKDILKSEKEFEDVQNKTGDCRAALLEKEQTEEPAHDQVARPNELNIPLNMEQRGSLLSPYETISPNTPTLDNASLLHPIAGVAQFVHYDPSSPATPTLDENFSYEAPSVAQGIVEHSVEGSGKQEAHDPESIKEDLHDEQQAEGLDNKLDTKCDPSKVETQELPVQQDVITEINTSASCEWKDDAEEQFVEGAEERGSSQKERKPKRPYTPVENPFKRRYLHSEEKSAVENKHMPTPVEEAVLVQVQNEERPTQSGGKIASKLEEKARSQTSDSNVQNKPTTRAAKKISSPEHVPVTERERRSSTSAKEKPTSDSKARKSPATVLVTRSRSQPSPVIKQGLKREASPGERRRGQHKIAEVPPKRTKR
uniref:biorientation of chromosomes in cell division protein 1-like 1 isoform X2 n=1 Tax=Pristiophorus japonicus TaxID=55135 RepID=UPI00398E8AD4